MYNRFIVILAYLLFSNTICKSHLSTLNSQIIFVELNCENLFDCLHDEGKEDTEFTPEGSRRWTRTRYWRKLNHIGQDILACADQLPDLVALVEVENDSVLRDLTRRSLLRHAGYEYLMTQSADVRGIDVALLYRPVSFRPLCYENIEVPPLKGMRPTRDILYVKGLTPADDTLHVFVVHAPSRYGGEQETRPHRRQVVTLLTQRLQPVIHGDVIIAGDFNDYADDASLLMLEHTGMQNISRNATGRNGQARATYRFQGHWHSLDHILLSPRLASRIDTVYINDADFLLEDEPRYGGKKPRRTYNGYRYNRGTSDHLPLVMIINN